MKVSVVIPAYNEEAYIEQCLSSLSKQTMKPDEIIVVDNNSTDNTARIVKKFDVRLINEKNQGITHARNTGFDAATGDIIARCDADTRAPTDWVKKIIENFSAFQIDALTGPATPYDFPTKSTIYTKTYFELLKLILQGKETIYGPNMAITKDIWDRVRSKICLDDTKVHEDIDLGIHIVKEGGVIRRDESLIVEASARRIRNPQSFFIEYPARLISTIKAHQKDD